MKPNETTTRPNLDETYGEDETTLVEREEVALSSADDENSVTFKIRQTRRLNPEQITRRLQGIEQRAKNDLTWKIRVRGVLEIFEQLIVWFDAWIRKKIHRKPLLVCGLVVCLVAVGLFVAFHHGDETNDITTKSLNTKEPQAIRLSPLMLTDLGRRIVDPQAVSTGRPFYVEFDVLDWNEQEGQRLDLSVDVRVFSQKGKVELFRPDVIKYAQATNKQTDKVHVKMYFNFTKEAAPGEYRLSLTVTEQATQRRAMMEKRIILK